MRLTSGDLVLDTASTLSFWHYYDTDPAYDGGVVEISTDGGTTGRTSDPICRSTATPARSTRPR
ncbi:hypothetical protein ACQ86N_03845 [Puia sp. P3]|uniref:hypothetical protein n=1 Tax=Puia sp. P3 TaxID=3423952 RepID=UPI003D665ECB